jgi:hypothetical protein
MADSSFLLSFVVLGGLGADGGDGTGAVPIHGVGAHRRNRACRLARSESTDQQKHRCRHKQHYLQGFGSKSLHFSLGFYIVPFGFYIVPFGGILAAAIYI